MKKGTLASLLLIPLFLMAQTNNKVTEEFLQSFTDAFNAHDVNAIMAHMTGDCVFEASAGPDANGERFAGREQVRKAFLDVFATFPDAQWAAARHFIQGERGFSEWVFTGTKADGTSVEVTGCDIFTFREGKISIKNSFRKNRVSTK